MASSITTQNRFGIHYYPDTLHYRQSDLRAWLPELRSLGVGWLVLLAPLDRAIPEDFIKEIIAAGIEPVLHFKAPLDPGLNLNDMQPLFQSYAAWGIKYTILFDRPNSRQSWPSTAWAQTDLVNRFLERYIPLAEALIDQGMQPIFPPLEPGGDYWDTAFLRAAFLAFLEKQKMNVLQKMVLGAYAGSGTRPLDWGKGGPEQWPGARPYYTPAKEQDQHGFYITDWYRALAMAVLGMSLPMMLFGVGSPGVIFESNSQEDFTEHATRTIILSQMAKDNPQSPFNEVMQKDILASNFWLMATANSDPTEQSCAWYQQDGGTAPVVGVLRQAQAVIIPEVMTPTKPPAREYEPGSQSNEKIASFVEAKSTPVGQTNLTQPAATTKQYLISHYLLLPTNQDGLMDFHLESVYPFIKKHNITVGFSLEEAALAAQVTILETDSSYPDQALAGLRAAGSKVVRLCGSGIELAHFLSVL